MHTMLWKSHTPIEPDVIHRQPTDQVKTTTKTPTIRRLYIRQDDLEAHGYTENCPKCQHIIVHGQSTPATMNHSTQSRTRITEAIASTANGQTRLNRLVEKWAALCWAGCVRWDALWCTVSVPSTSSSPLFSSHLVYMLICKGHAVHA